MKNTFCDIRTLLLVFIGWVVCSTSAFAIPTDSECIFDWAETQVPNLLTPAHQPTQTVGTIAYRFYPTSGVYVGIEGVSVLALGGVVGSTVTNLGALKDFLMIARTARCGASAQTQWTVGGTVSGLRSGKNVVLQTNWGETLTLTANGKFVFATSLSHGTEFKVTVKSASDGLQCGSDIAIGAMDNQPIDWLNVQCFVPATLTALGDLPEGDWVQGACNPSSSSGGTGTRSFRRLIRQARSSALDMWVGYGAASIEYTNTDCLGDGQVISLGSYGAMGFSAVRKEADTQMTAYWGGLSPMKLGYLSSPTVLVRKDQYLCSIEDTSPSTYPNVASLSTVVNTAIATGQCYAP